MLNYYLQDKDTQAELKSQHRQSCDNNVEYYWKIIELNFFIIFLMNKKNLVYTTQYSVSGKMVTLFSSAASDQGRMK